MLTKRDNMYLKVFRHTGYESILEGEITETGVGFVIRKKLLRLGDLFKPMRPKAEKENKNETSPMRVRNSCILPLRRTARGGLFHDSASGNGRSPVHGS